MSAEHALEDELRRLAAWYEWGSAPHAQVIAETLQDAADAVRVHALSPEAAGVMVRVWDYFVGREAAVGNGPPDYSDVERVDVLRCAVADLTRILERAPRETRGRLAKLLRKQLRTLEREERRLR